MILLDECNRFNTVFSSLNTFKELFPIGDFLIQPHLMHISHLKPSDDRNLRHQHRTFEFSLLLSGSVRYQFCEFEDEIMLQPGDAVVIPAEVPHLWQPCAEESVIFGFMFYIFAKNEETRNELEELRRHIFSRRLHIAGFEQLQEVVARIIKTARKAEGYQEEMLRCLVGESFIELFSILIPPIKRTRKNTDSGRVPRGDNSRRLGDSVQFYIHDNTCRPLSPTEVASHIGLSLNRLNHVLKQECGKTLGQLIRDQKFSIASNLLTSTNRQIKDIAAAVGIEDVTYFCRIFKRMHGISPAKYRNATRK